MQEQVTNKSKLSNREVTVWENRKILKTGKEIDIPKEYKTKSI